MKGWIVVSVTGALVGLGLLALHDPPTAPHRGITVVPARSVVLEGTVRGDPAPWVKTGSGADRPAGSVTAEMAENADDDSDPGSIWDDGGRLETWSPPEPPATG